MGSDPRGAAKQGLKADFSLIEEISLGQYHRGVSAAPALPSGILGVLPEPKQALEEEASTRRPVWNSACDDPRIRTPAFLRAPVWGCAWSQLPSHACRAWPCPSHTPGPPPLPVQSMKLRTGGGPHHRLGSGRAKGSRGADALA